MAKPHRVPAAKITQIDFQSNANQFKETRQSGHVIDDDAFAERQTSRRFLPQQFTIENSDKFDHCWQYEFAGVADQYADEPFVQR